MKRILALLISLTLWCAVPLASAEEAGGGTIATYLLPEGAEILTFEEAHAFKAPQGLEGMYDLMLTGNGTSDVYLARMKNGRALLSVSCTEMDREGTAQALADTWPAIVKTISLSARYLNADASCVSIEQKYGYETLKIRTDIAVGQEELVLLTADCTAFYRGTDLIEVWAVAPSPLIYLYDDEAAAELESDRKDIEALLNSLNFEMKAGGNTLSSSVQKLTTETYVDPDGYFSLEMIAGSHVITPYTRESDAKMLRETMGEKWGDGARHAFDLWYQDVRQEGATLMVTPDLSMAVQLYCIQDAYFAEATPDDLLTLAGDIEQSLNSKFGYALSLRTDATVSISGLEHAWLSYWLRSEKTNFMLNVLACVERGDWLRELDIYSVTDQIDLGAQDALMEMILTTLTYHVPADGERV